MRYGSFYLRLGIVAFGIGSMVYCGLEFGQYFELKNDPECQNILIALTPATRLILTLAQIQFIFLNKKEIFMAKHQIVSRFGLMHLIATNLCEWLYVIIEETKHEIVHFKEKHDISGKERRLANNSIFNMYLSPQKRPLLEWSPIQRWQSLPITRSFVVQPAVQF